MKNPIFIILLAMQFILTSCDNGTVGKYQKEALPYGFSYNIIEDRSNEKLEKNELTVEINQRLTEGQIATLAEKLFNSKPQQRRFYIFLLLPGMKNGAGAWATSHFDPELKIEISGTSIQQKETSNKKADEKIDGDMIGKWNEEQYSSSHYIIYKKNKKTFLKVIYKDGQVSEEELGEKKQGNTTRYNYKNGGYNGEYFIVNESEELDFYNSENKKFTTAKKL